MDPLTIAGIGMGVNALGGLLGGMGAQEAAEADARARKEMLQMQINEGRQAYSDVAPSFQPYMQTGQEGLGALSTLAQNAGQYDYTPEQFQYGQTTQEFLDPSMDFQQDQMRRQLEASQSMRGGLLSGGALKELQQRGAQLAQTDYANANQRMMNDKRFAYGAFMDNANARRQSLQQGFQNRLGIANQQTNLGQFGTTGNANARMGVAKNISNAIGNQIDPMAGNAQVQAGAPYMMGQGLLNSVVNQDTMGALGQYMTPQGTGTTTDNMRNMMNIGAMGAGGGVAQGNVNTRGY